MCTQMAKLAVQMQTKMVQELEEQYRAATDFAVEYKLGYRKVFQVRKLNGWAAVTEGTLKRRIADAKAGKGYQALCVARFYVCRRS